MAKSARKARASTMPKRSGSRKRRKPRPLTLRVIGAGPPGRIPVPELLVLCQQAQTAVERQAEALKGKDTLRPGPTTELVRMECTLELSSLGRGSATLGFDLTKPQASLPDMAALGEQAILGVVEAIDMIAEGRPRAVDPGVLDSLNGLGQVFDRERVRSIEWITHRANGRGRPKRVVAIYNQKVKRTVAALVKTPTVARVTIEGIVEMADFRPGDLKCRVLQPLGPAIPCTFPPDEADNVYAVLRKTARIEGDGTLNPQSGRIDGVRILSVTPIDSLSIGKGHFWRGSSLEDLAVLQGIEPLVDPEVLAGGLPEDEDVDALLADVYRQRE